MKIETTQSSRKSVLKFRNRQNAGFFDDTTTTATATTGTGTGPLLSALPTCTCPTGLK